MILSDKRFGSANTEPRERSVVTPEMDRSHPAFRPGPDADGESRLLKKKIDEEAVRA